MVLRWVSGLPIRLLVRVIFNFAIIKSSLTQKFLYSLAAELSNLLSLLQLLKTLQSCANHVVRIGGTQRLGQDILNTCKLKNRTGWATGDNTGTFCCRLHEHTACTEDTNHLMRDSGILQGNINQILLGILDALANCLRYLCCLAQACTNLALEFPLLEPLKEKRKISRLYIDADEDHVSLQYLEKKGDIKKPRINTVMPKLIYVYEDVSFDGSKHELVNGHYFGGDYAGTEGTKELWQELWNP